MPYRFSIALLLLTATAYADLPKYPPMPEAFSSFGAAVCDGYVYVYGGHVAKTHTYSTAAVTGKFRRLKLAAPSAWEELPAGTPLQGLALVSHGGKLYRIGGMQPRNTPDESADNHSTTECMVYDPKTAKWDAGPALPAGRSSHDACVVGDTIVVVGGWHMQGKGAKTVWHDQALILDLSKTPLRWEAVAQPFQRRALNVAAADGKVYVLGGMNSENETEKTVDVFDLKTRRWSAAPALPGMIRNGFTPAGCVCDGKIYASPADGKLYRLSDKKDAWDEVGVLEKKRLVHRIVPAAADLLLALGGAVRDSNLASVEAIEPACCVTPAVKRPTDPNTQQFCPIMTAMPIEAESREVEYKGVKIKVCCTTCLRKWKEDPEAYLNVALLPQLKGMELPARKLAQVYCPIYTDRVVAPSSPSAEHNGARIYFFNETAKKRFLDEPARYLNPTLLPQLRATK